MSSSFTNELCRYLKEAHPSPEVTQLFAQLVSLDLFPNLVLAQPDSMPNKTEVELNELLAFPILQQLHKCPEQLAFLSPSFQAELQMRESQLLRTISWKIFQYLRNSYLSPHSRSEDKAEEMLYLETIFEPPIDERTFYDWETMSTLSSEKRLQLINDWLDFFVQKSQEGQRNKERRKKIFSHNGATKP